MKILEATHPAVPHHGKALGGRSQAPGDPIKALSAPSQAPVGLSQFLEGAWFFPSYLISLIIVACSLDNWAAAPKGSGQIAGWLVEWTDGRT